MPDGYAAKLRQVLGRVGVLPYYTFSVKGYRENWHNFATNARAVQEQMEERVFGAIHNGDPTDDLIAIKYLEALQGVADGRATKIFLPLDTSGVLGAVAAMGEMFKESQGEPTS